MESTGQELIPGIIFWESVSVCGMNSPEVDPSSRRSLGKRHAYQFVSNNKKKRLSKSPEDGPAGSLSNRFIDDFLGNGDFRSRTCKESVPKIDQVGGKNLEFLIKDPQVESKKEPVISYLIRFVSSTENLASSDFEGRKLLAKEISMLSSFRHHGIVNLLRTSSEPTSEPHAVLENLTCTLDEKLSRWIRSPSQNFTARLRIIHGIASALDYLHDKKITYRGLEPANVGFDESEKPKLFSFACARELPTEGEGTFNLTSMVGSRNYIAPSNFVGEPYGISGDVYSLCILTWEVLAMQRAFADVPDDKEFIEVVVKGLQRPKISKDWPLIIRNILRYGWTKQQTIRPPMKVIAAALDQHLNGTPVASPMAEYIQFMLLSNGTFMDYN